MKKLAAYKAACADASTKRTHWPDAPVSENGIAQDFFTTVDLASRPIQHSQAAAHRNRNDMYAAHKSNGKADIWLTITPRDDLSHLVVSYGKGFEEGAAKSFELPSENFRLPMLAERPVAAELYFERVFNIVFDRVIGWDQKNHQARPEGGIFGRARAWARTIEEQGRKTLHMHILLWLENHQDLEMQLDKMKNGLATFDISSVDELLRKLTCHVSSCIQSELSLPNEEMETATHCLQPGCHGKVHLTDENQIKRMQKRRRHNEGEPACLSCETCSHHTTCSDQINRALDCGFQRTSSRNRLTTKEIHQIIYDGLPLEPINGSKNERDNWKLKLATIQNLMNTPQ